MALSSTGPKDEGIGFMGTDAAPDLSSARPGSCYEPAQGHRFNPHKVVQDPYARSIGCDVRWADELFSYRLGDPGADLSCDDRDNAAYAP
jgi:isoamylase